MTDNDNSPQRTPSTGPLEGIQVVEVANFVSGPFAAMMLANLGATVTKVEPPRGDPYRRFGRPTTAMSTAFANANRGKRSVRIDLKSTSGRNQLLELLRGADVFLANWRPSVATRLGLDDDMLEGLNDQLVRVYITGYGPTGPLASRPVFDSVVQARSGLTDTQRVGTEPVVATTNVVDKVTATMACQAALAGLVARQTTGRGDRFDVAMLDAASYFNFPDGLGNRTFIEHSPAEARNTQASAVRPLRGRDGWLVISPVTGEQMRQCCAALGHPEWLDELRALGDGAAVTKELFRRAEERIQTGTVHDWLAVFDAHDVPAGPCHSIDAHLADEQVVHSKIYAEAFTPGVGPTRVVRYPAVSKRYGRLGATDVAPALGDHDQPSLDTAGTD